LATFSDWWLIGSITGGTQHLDFFDVTEKYDSLARIGPNTLLTCDPEFIRRMLGIRTPYTRSDWYFAMRFDPSRENVLSQSDNEKHNLLRAKVAAGYSGKEVESLEKPIDQNVMAFVDLIGRKYNSTSSEFKPFEFARKVQYFTLDTISNVAFGPLETWKPTPMFTSISK